MIKKFVDLTATEMMHLLHTGEVSALTLVENCLTAINAYDSTLNAFKEVYADEALAAAKEATQARIQHRTLSPLHGVPIVIKDNMEWLGRLTTGGSKAWSERRSTCTASVVQRLLEAGAIILGKTHTVEFAMGGWGTNQHLGTPLNPWDLHTPRTPGGSSSGTAVAIAAGLTPWGLGSDTGGSIRTPAAWCGLTGLKVSTGRISGYGILPLSTTLDTPGLLCKDVVDTQLLYQLLQGRDDKDPHTLQAPPAHRQGRTLDARALRLGYIGEAQRAKVDAEVLRAYDEALATWRDNGATLVEASLPYDFESVAELNGIIMVSEGYPLHAKWLDDPSQPIDDDVRRRLLPGRDMPASRYFNALQKRVRMCQEMDTVFTSIDAILTPTTLTPALPLEEVDQTGAPSHFSRFANFFNLPALAVPCGITPQGLPLSLQIIGRTWAEAHVLEIGRIYQQLTQWHHIRPDLSAL